MSNNNLPDFSIITPTFRRPSLLKRTINSVINQTFSNYEHIIIDDANDAETAGIVNGFGDKRIIFLQHQTPRGAAGGYNTGIRISRSRFILFLDDDDEYLPTLLEKMYDRFTKAEQKVGFIWTGVSRILDSDNGEKVLHSKIWPSQFPTKEIGLREATSIGNGFGVCVRKKCIDVAGLYDESIMIGEDTDFLFRLAKNFDFETIPEVLVKIHQHDFSQLTDEKNYMIRLNQREEILERHVELLYKFPKLYNVHFKAIAVLCYSLKLKKKGRKTMFSIIKNTPYHFLSYVDLLFFELTGRDTANFFKNTIFKKIKPA